MSLARNLANLKPNSSGLIVNANIDASASIAKTKLASLDIVNADVNASAGIVATKLGTMATANMPSGSIIQVVSINKATAQANNSASYTSLYADSDCLKITPSATSSKILIQYMLDRGNGSVSGEAATDYRIITTIGGSQSNYILSHGVINISNAGYRYGSQGSFLGTVVSPSTTSEITFNIQSKVYNSQKASLNIYGDSIGIIAMEIKG